MEKPEEKPETSEEKEEKPKIDSAIKPLLNSQIELIGIKMEQLNNVLQLEQQRRTEIRNLMNTIALELGVPQKQLGEWRLSQDGKSLRKIQK